MNRAFVWINPGVAPRLESFTTGLARLGYRVIVGERPKEPTPADIAVTWNRFGLRGQYAHQVERAGGRVLVTENGYCGADREGRQFYALALKGHLGTGEWHPETDDRRWRQLGIELKPWRPAGRHVVVCCSRGIGPPSTAMPKDWPKRTQATLAAMTRRSVVVRMHPADRVSPCKRPLTDDLAGAHAVVVWASNAGTEALLAGVPVLHGLGDWIMAPAARHGIEALEDPYLGDRVPAFVRMSWAQWTLDEIATGEPFARLLRRDA